MAKANKMRCRICKGYTLMSAFCGEECKELNARLTAMHQEDNRKPRVIRPDTRVKLFVPCRVELTYGLLTDADVKELARRRAKLMK